MRRTLVALIAGAVLLVPAAAEAPTYVDRAAPIAQSLDVDTTPVELRWVDSMDGLCNAECVERNPAGLTFPDGRVYVRKTQPNVASSLLHELAHAWTFNDGHGQEWCGLWFALVDGLYPEYSDGVRIKALYNYPSCGVSERPS